jgi:hypothetical protein
MIEKSLINVFEMKLVRRDIGFKISAADVYNSFLYLGDEKGSIHSYPIRAGDGDVIPRGNNDNSRLVCKSKIDRILGYGNLGGLLVLAGETLYMVDSALRKV